MYTIWFWLQQFAFALLLSISATMMFPSLSHLVSVCSLHWQGSFIRVSEFNENYSSVASEATAAAAAAAYGFMTIIPFLFAHIHTEAHHRCELESLRLKLWQFAIIIGITLHCWMFIVFTARLHSQLWARAYMCMFVAANVFCVIAFQRYKMCRSLDFL